MNKQSRRECVLHSIDVLLESKAEIDRKIKLLVEDLEGEWVIRKRIVKQRRWHGDVNTGYPSGTCHYYGCRNPGTKFYRNGCIFTDPMYEHGDDKVKVYKSPRDAVFVAECEAGSDRKYEDQPYYLIEVVDRLDGEVYAVIEKPWRYSPKSS